MEKIKEYFEKEFKMSDGDWQTFSSKLVKKEFSKKTVLLKVGQIENYLSFVETGSIRFYVVKEFDDLTFGFAFAGNFVSAYESFLTKQPTTYNVETLTQTTVWRITFDDLQNIYKETEIGNAIGRKAAEDIFLKKSTRELSFLTQSPEQRYLNLFIEQPHLLQKIALKHIASYIGITPQALSRIRKRIS